MRKIYKCLYLLDNISSVHRKIVDFTFFVGSFMILVAVEIKIAQSSFLLTSLLEKIKAFVSDEDLFNVNVCVFDKKDT